MNKETAVKAAVAWWKDFIAGETPLGWEHSGTTPFVEALVAIGAGERGPTEEQISRFCALLDEYLTGWISNKAWDEDRPKWGAYCRIVSTDNKNLHDLAARSGISSLLLPDKIRMEISPDGINVGCYKEVWEKIPARYYHVAEA